MSGYGIILVLSVFGALRWDRPRIVKGGEEIMWAKGLLGRPPCVKLKEALRDWGRVLQGPRPTFAFSPTLDPQPYYRKTGLLCGRLLRSARASLGPHLLEQEAILWVLGSPWVVGIRTKQGGG